MFGGKTLFEKLCKNRNKKSKERQQLKRKWREQRQGSLISVGSKADKGNRLTRFESINGELHLRITTGKREFVYAKVLRKPSNQGTPSSCKGAKGRNPKQGETKKVSQSAWQVLKVAFLFPVLGKILPRDLSPLKSLLVEGAWDRVRSRLVPLEVGGTPQ